MKNMNQFQPSQSPFQPLRHDNSSPAKNRVGEANIMPGLKTSKFSKFAWLKNKKGWAIGLCLIIVIGTVLGLVLNRKKVTLKTTVTYSQTKPGNQTTQPTPQNPADTKATASPGNSPGSSASPPQTSGGSSGTITTAPPAGSTPKTSACGNTAIPDGACTVILSIEKDGVKNNPSVTFDTTNIPDGTQVVLDRTSWSNFGSAIGAIDGRLTYSNQSYSGSLTFQLLSNGWKVTNYLQNP